MSYSNPFAEIRKQVSRKKVDDWEEVDGPMTCQHCFLVAQTGLYSAKLKVVTWECDDGHESRIEGYTYG